MNGEKALYINSPVGRLCIMENEDGICGVLFEKESIPEHHQCSSPLLLEAQTQLREYFDGKRREFDLPLSPKGTDFQKAVWKALLTIPYGETRSYGQIAAMVGNPKASRAVGMANNRNPISIIVPCHRVVGADGGLVGYGGGLDKKEFLLKLERGNH